MPGERQLKVGHAVSKRVVPVTPLTVGQVMSKDDVYYTPHANVNPFISNFLDSAVKIIDGRQMSVTDDDASGLHHHNPSKLILSRSLSLPSSPSMSYDDDGAARCLTADSSDEATSSGGDSALGHDVRVIARCMHDFEVLFDEDNLSCCLTDDSTTTDDVISPEERDKRYNSNSELSSTVWRDRFQRLLANWQTRQLDASPSRLPPRLRLAVPYLVQRFAELRRAWEEQQISSTHSSK